jgi:protein arginine N-methyltransferase 1
MGSYQNGVGGGERSATGVDKGVDFAQYFCTYAFLYHQKEMLSDRVRMDAYFNAIFQNKHHFQGKVSLSLSLSLSLSERMCFWVGTRERLKLF